LFCSDQALSAEKIIAFYSLRFQIEFNFRDAKQFWGLEDFMTVSQTAVTNSANLSLFMVNLTHLLLKKARQSDPLFSVLDLKAQSRGYLYMIEMIKMLPQKPDDILVSQLFSKVTALGRIHAPEPASALI
jgi:putative transposase